MQAGLQTEFEFLLPKGVIDQFGNLHRKGTMRLATAADEIIPLRDPRVRNNQAYLSIILLARVITKLGTLEEVHTGIVENMFSSDLAYLQAMYNRINSTVNNDGVCPSCGRPFDNEEDTRGQVAVGAGVGG